MFLLIFSMFFAAPTQAHAQMDLLTMKELSQLDQRARAYYIETYREMMGDLEKFQGKFEKKNKTALNISPEQKIWSLIFESAYAAEVSFSRGNAASDRCVWAGNLQTYAGAGRCIAPSCSGSEQSRYGTGSVKCSLIGTGSSDCISAGLSMNSTVECSNRAKKCADSNKTVIDGIVAGGGGNSSSADLAKYACDPRVMSMLIKQVAQKGADDLPENVRNELNAFDVAKNGVNGIVSAYQGHCSAPIDNSVMNSLSQANRNKANQIIKAGGKPTVADVVQTAECQQLTSRVTVLQAKFNDVAAQVPNHPKLQPASATQAEPPAVGTVATGAPVDLHRPPVVNTPTNPVPPAVATMPPVTVTAAPIPEPVPVIKPAAAPLPPIPPAKPIGTMVNNEGGDGTALANTSCIKPADREMISNRGMACVACLTDNSGGYGSAGVSSKWLALLGTIGQICGKPLNAEESLYFVQAVGHCGAQDYKWEPGLSESDRQLARDWQNGINLDKMDARNGSSGNASTFTRVYGIDRTAVKNVFCDSFQSNYRGRFANDKAGLWVQRVQSMSGLDYNKARSGTVENQLYKDDFRKLKGQPKIDSSEIHKCLAKAKLNKSQLNLEDGGKQCTLIGGMTLGSVDHVVKKMENGRSVMSVNRANPNECWVSLAASKYKRGEQMVTFTNPLSGLDAPIESNGQYNRVNYSSTKGSNPVNAIEVLSMASPDYCTKKSQVINNYIVPSVPATGSASGSGSPAQPEGRREVKPPTTPVHYGN